MTSTRSQRCEWSRPVWRSIIYQWGSGRRTAPSRPGRQIAQRLGDTHLVAGLLLPQHSEDLPEVGHGVTRRGSQEGHVLAPLGSGGRVQGARVQGDQGEPVAQGACRSRAIRLRSRVRAWRATDTCWSWSWIVAHRLQEPRQIVQIPHRDP